MKVSFTSTLLVSIAVLFSLLGSSEQAVYSCNPSASCGCSTNTTVLTRIVGGENASSATWGWAVSISIAGGYLCGGSIINESWVLTAAHCIHLRSPAQIIVYAGSLRQWWGTQTRTVSNVVEHPDYHTTTYVNDIALLKMTTPWVLTDPYVSKVCLPSVSAETLAAGEWPAVGTSVFAVGWGRLTDGGSLPAILQQVTMQAISYRAATCAPLISDWTKQLCAGVPGGGKDACQGDSGGPLMIFSSSQRWVLVGVTSNGVGCAGAQYSGIYTRVAAYQDWISATTNSANKHTECKVKLLILLVPFLLSIFS